MPATAPAPSAVVVSSARPVYGLGRSMSQGDPFGAVVAKSLLPLTELTFGAILGEIFPASDVEVDHERMFYCLSWSAAHAGVEQEMLLLNGATRYHQLSRL